MRAAFAPTHGPARRFRPNLASVVRRVRADGVYVVLTRRGTAVAGVVRVGALDLLATTGGRLWEGTRVPVRRFRRDLPALLRQVRDDPEYVVLTRRGLSVAAVVPMAVRDLLDAAEVDLATRFLATIEGLRDLATAAPDVTPRTDTPAASPRGSRRLPVTRRGQMIRSSPSAGLLQQTPPSTSTSRTPSTSRGSAANRPATT